MNPYSTPPPLPEEKNSTAARSAAVCLSAALVTTIIGIVLATSAIDWNQHRIARLALGGFVFLCMLTGLIFGIVALCGLRRFNRARVLGLGLPGLAINAAFLVIMVMGAVKGFKEAKQQAAERRRVTEEIRQTSADVQKSARQSFDPESGATNLNSKSFDKLADQMRDASKSLSGDDAVVMGVMANHLTRIQNGMKAYEAATKPFVEGQVLNTETLTEKSQIEERRQIVRNFLEENSKLRKLIEDSEKNMRADFAKTKLSSQKIEAAMAGFHSKAAPRNSLTMKIRDCDQRIGDAAIGALDLFEASWGKWRAASSTKQVLFNEDSDVEAYNRFMKAITAASQEQLALQKRLINMPTD